MTKEYKRITMTLYSRKDEPGLFRMYMWYLFYDKQNIYIIINTFDFRIGYRLVGNIYLAITGTLPDQTVKVDLGVLQLVVCYYFFKTGSTKRRLFITLSEKEPNRLEYLTAHSVRYTIPLLVEFGIS